MNTTDNTDGARELPSHTDLLAFLGRKVERCLRDFESELDSEDVDLTALAIDLPTDELTKLAHDAFKCRYGYHRDLASARDGAAGSKTEDA